MARRVARADDARTSVIRPLRGNGVCRNQAGWHARGRILMAVSDPWLLIEVLDGEVSASEWRRAHAETLIDAAIADRAVRWSWRVHDRGVVFEIAFRTDRIRDEFCGRFSVRTALDAVPDPQCGLNVLPGGGD